MCFQPGDLVLVYNHEHVWHNQLAIVRNKSSNGFYRIELLGVLSWVPEHWLITVEEEESGTSTDEQANY